MYAQITITAQYDDAMLKRALINQIGISAVPALQVLLGTSFAAVATEIAPTVIAAQLLRNAASVVYFFDGPDTVLIHITAATVTELKSQAKRVTRQMLPSLASRKRIVRGSIFVQESQGADVLIIDGARVSMARQVVGALSEKWLSKLVVPATVFALTAYRMSGTTAAQSA